MPNELMSVAPKNQTQDKLYSPATQNVAVAAPKATPVGAIPFGPPAPASPVYNDSRGASQRLQVRQKATELAKTVSTSTVTPSQFQNDALTPQADKQGQQNALLASTVATPGVIQSNKLGETAIRGAGQAANEKALADMAASQAKSTASSDAIKAQNDAATAAGVSMKYVTQKDPKTGTEISFWVNSTTGEPQIPPSKEPITEGKYGQQQGDMILNGQYFGLTTGQADAIEKAGGDVKKKYDEAIGAQERQSAQDQATALIRGGQSGGLLNSQISGTAATKAGPNWVGAGGTLKRLQEDYDRAVTSLKEEAIKAENQARDYALTAARTGKAADLDAANAAKNYIAEVQGRQQAAAVDLAKQQKELLDIRKLERADALATVDSIAASGYESFDSLPKAYQDALDESFQAGGLPPGSARMAFATSKTVLASKAIEDEQKRQAAEVTNAKNIVGLLKDIPVGKSIPIGGFTYEGLSRGDIQKGTETDSNGNVTYYEYDPATQRSVSTRITGPNGEAIGKSVDGWETKIDDAGKAWRLNAKTGQQVPYSPTNEQINIQRQLPDGSVWMRNGKVASECGQLTNDLTGAGVGDTKESKLAKCDLTIKPGTDNPPQVGDFFVQTNGFGWTGHIGVVAGVDEGPDGKTIIRALESNYPQPGKVTSSRPVDASKIAAFGRTGKNSPMLKQLLGGPDSATGEPTFGTKPKEGEKVLGPDEIKKYGLDPTDPTNFGLTLPQVQMKRAEQLAKEPVPPHKMSFEDFTSKRMADIQSTGVAGPVDPKQLKVEFEEQQDLSKSVDEAVNAIKRGKYSNLSEKGEFVQQAEDLMNSGDYTGLENLVTQVGRKSMSIDQQNKYDSSRNLVETYQSGLDMLQTFAQDKDFRSGNLKAIVERAKKTGAYDADPRYVQLNQLLGTAQNEYRNALFGASLTPNELAEANKVIIDQDSDTPATMWDKMEKGIKIQEFVSDARLADALGTKRPKLSDYLKK